MRRLVFTLALGAFLAAWTAGFGAAAPILPQGVSSADIVSGLYPVYGSGWCCWIGDHAILTIPVPAGADAVVVTLLVPSDATVPGGTAIAASFDGVAARSVCCFGEGVYQAAFQLPRRSAQDRRVIMRITPSSHFVPAERGINNDRRTLSVLLRAIVVENTLTDERYLDGVAIAGGSSMPAYLLDLLLVAIGILTLALVWRRTAFAWVMLLLTDPFGLTGVTLLGIVAAFGLRRISLRPLRDRRILAIAAAFLIFIISMAASSLRAKYLGPAVRETVMAAAYLPAFAVAALAYRTEPDRNLLRRTLAFLTIIVALLALSQLWTGASESMLLWGHTVSRIAGLLEGPNQLGAFLGILLPLLLSLAIGERPRREEIVAFCLGAAALVLTFSRAGLLACVLACALVLLLRSRRRAVVLAVVAVLWLTIATATVQDALGGSNRLIDAIFPARITDAYNGGLGTRAALWHGAIAMWSSHPVLGVGPGNYELALSSFAPGVRTHANNYYFQALAEQGVVGLLALLLLIGTTVRVLYDGHDALCVGVLAVVVAFAFHQLVDGLLIYPKIGDLYWALIGMAVP